MKKICVTFLIRIKLHAFNINDSRFLSSLNIMILPKYESDVMSGKYLISPSSEIKTI